MAKFTIKTVSGSTMIRHRAECSKHSFHGPWHTNPEDADKDAEDHEENFNAPHNLKVITEERVVRHFRRNAIDNKDD